MLTFRNRLLILLIGLVLGAQTVTFLTALARTKATERQRADAQLVAGAQIARKLRRKLVLDPYAVLKAPACRAAGLEYRTLGLKAGT